MQPGQKSKYKHLIFLFKAGITRTPGGETFSFFCDSGKQLEILNFLPDIQDLGHTVCRL